MVLYGVLCSPDNIGDIWHFSHNHKGNRTLTFSMSTPHINDIGLLETFRYSPLLDAALHTHTWRPPRIVGGEKGTSTLSRGDYKRDRENVTVTFPFIHSFIHSLNIPATGTANRSLPLHACTASYLVRAAHSHLAHQQRKHVGLLSSTSQGRAARSPKTPTSSFSSEDSSQDSGSLSSETTEEHGLGSHSIMTCPKLKLI